MNEKRLFVAAEIPDDLKEKFREVQSKLHPRLTQTRMVRTSSIHLTLKFLGPVKEDRIPDIHQQLKNIPFPEIPPEVICEGLGVFPSSARPRVLWAGLSCPESLKTLQSCIEDTLESLGFLKENKPFSPHLTLGRMRGRENRQEVERCLDEYRSHRFTSFSVAQFVLFESRLLPEGARYTPLHTYPDI